MATIICPSCGIETYKSIGGKHICPQCGKKVGIIARLLGPLWLMFKPMPKRKQNKKEPVEKNKDRGKKEPGMTQMEINVVLREEDYPAVIAKHIAINAPIQVLVTGPDAYNLFRNHQRQIMSAIGPGWAYFGSPDAPTYEDMSQWVQRFAQIVRDSPNTKHIWFGPTDDHEVRENLFYVAPLKPYRAAIYVLGLCNDPLRYMTGLSMALNEPGRAIGKLVSIFSLPDSLLTQQVREKLLTALKQGGADKIAYEYMQML